jgi:nucleoside-diphosphate-sugar epimerase
MALKEEKAMTRIAVAGATGRVGRHVVDVLRGGGHDVVAISRSNGVDVITGDGLAAALEGDPDDALNTNGGLLPGPHATLAGPTFAQWLEAN